MGEAIRRMTTSGDRQHNEPIHIIRRQRNGNQQCERSFVGVDESWIRKTYCSAGYSQFRATLIRELILTLVRKGCCSTRGARSSVLRRIPCDGVTPSPFDVTGEHLTSSTHFCPRHSAQPCVLPPASLHLVTTPSLAAARRRHIALVWVWTT